MRGNWKIWEPVNQLSGSREMAYAIHAHAKLLEEGWADSDSCLINWDDRAVIAVEAARPGITIGIITWSKIDWRKEASIKIGYVEPSWRRRGVYRAMYEQLMLEARGLNLQSIRSAIKIDNEASLAMLRSIPGRELESYNTVHWL